MRERQKAFIERIRECEEVKEMKRRRKRNDW